MDLRRKLGINWWLWALVSVPWIFTALFQRWEDKGGGVWSDAVYRIRVGEWRYCGETVFGDLFLPLLSGWLAQ
jgi:hypothetical protein